jgi:hypothetical protein
LHCFACGNNPDIVPSPRIDHYQDATKSVHSDGNIALFSSLEIIKRNGVGIFEDCKCIGKGDPVLGLIFFGLLFIPFEPGIL